MARTKIRRRTYNNINTQPISRLKEAEGSRIEEPVQNVEIGQPRENCPYIPTTNTETSDMLSNSVDQEVCPDSESQNSSILGCSQKNISITQTETNHRPPFSNQMSNISSLQDIRSSTEVGLLENCIDKEDIESLDKDDFRQGTSDKEGLQDKCSEKEKKGQVKSFSDNDVDLEDNCSDLPAVNLTQSSPILGSGKARISVKHTQISKGLASDHISDIVYSQTSPPVNLTWDSSTKENCQLQANFRPITPEMSDICVDEIFSPNTQKKLRTSIRNLFPNGPPPPPPVKPVKRPKKGDLPYIVGCTKRSRVPSPRSLTVFQGDDYGITDETNCDADEQCPAKRGRRGPNGTASLSKSRFNPLSDEIAARLKLYEKIDKLLGRTPKEETVGYMTKPSKSRSQAFSPLPSTSTDNETIMKNEKHFSESFNCDNDNFDIDDDEELPEIVWDSNKCKEEKVNDADPALYRKDIKNSMIDVDDIPKKESNNNAKNIPTKQNMSGADNVPISINEDLNNNNDVIPMDYEFCEIDFDKYIPKEKIIDCTDMPDVPVLNSKPKLGPQLIDTIDLKHGYSSTPSRVLFQRKDSTDVICIDDDFNASIASTKDPAVTTNESSTHVTSPVLRARNRMATATEVSQSNQVIEVPDIIQHTVNTASQPSTSRPIWNADVEFVSETRTNEPRVNGANIPDVQVVGSSPSKSTNRQINDELLNVLQQFFSLPDSYSGRTTQNTQPQPKKKSKRVPKQSNISPVAINNENTAPTVNQVSIAETPAPSSQSPGKKLGDCPICLDSLSTGSIASTNCGHVFCLDCIKRSLSTSGKRCPTCRKQLKGAGYHQVFL